MNKPVAYRSFAEFFDRRFRGDARSFVFSPFMMAAFAEARYFGWEELRPDQHFPIKGVSLDAKSILGNEQQAKSFSGGPVILARLSPMDYHHVHYPDDGKTISQDKYGGRLWTVNRNALQSMREILFEMAASTNLGDRQFWPTGIRRGGCAIRRTSCPGSSDRGALPTRRGKSRSSNLVDPRSRSSANAVGGVRLMISCATPLKVPKRLYGSVSRWRALLV